MQRIPSFICLAIGLCTALSLSAQSTVGLRLGVGSNQLSTTSGLDLVGNQLSGIKSLELAVFTEFPLNNQFSFQPELQYTSRGFGLDLSSDATVAGISLPIGAKATSRFQYIEAPLLLKAAFGNEATQFYFLAGPSVAYAMSGRLKTTARALFEFELTDSPINLDAINYQRLAINGIAGIGLQHSLASGIQMSGDLRYTHGFSQLYDIPLISERLSNQAFSASIGVGIKL